MINTAANGVVDIVKYGHRHKGWLSAIALLAILAIGFGYVLFGALRVNPFAPTYRVAVELPESGGLLPRQDVSIRGFPVGRVDSLTITPGGIDAVARIQSEWKIPADSKVRVSGLSAAGEQFIDFMPDSENGPFLQDGSTIPLGRATVPITLAEMLANSDGTLKQVNTEKLEILKKELSMTDAGPGKLADIVDGGTFMLSTLDSVLPETTSLLRSSKVVLTMVGDKNSGLTAAATNLNQSFTGIAKMQNGFRTLTTQTPQTLNGVDNLFTDNSDTMVTLLGSLASSSQLLYLRVPALNALFPNYRTSVLDAIGSTMHDGGLWATGDIYPRYSCDYGTPRRPPSSADYPEPYMYNYCATDDPAVLIRGAKNAPRPAGDDTAGPPPGADLGQMTDPTPKGRFSIPTPYGGPTLPIEPPH